MFRKFLLASIAVVVTSLLLSSGLGLWLAHRDHRRSLVRLQQEKAATGAQAVERFVEGIERQLAASGQTMGSSLSPERMRAQQDEFRRLLFQVGALSDVAWLDRDGHERVLVSRLTPDRINDGRDRSSEPAVRLALARGSGAGDVVFEEGSEPHMSIAVTTSARGPVVVADLNLRLVRDVVSAIRVGEHGVAYLVDRRGRLIAHPDLALVLSQTDLSGLTQVRRALASRPTSSGRGQDAGGATVLASHHRIDGLEWALLVEQPNDEVFAPLWGAAAWRLLVLALGVVLAVVSAGFLTRRMVAPLHVLEDGAARIGDGDLQHRIELRTGDELEGLATALNAMAERLQAADADLRASRQRLVAAQDEERRRLERDLHDGAQQELVALRVSLGLIEQVYKADKPIEHLLASAKDEAGEALESLRNLARGIYPPLLAAEGLPAALESQARRCPIPVEVEAEGVARYPQEVEAAAYFCCLEAMQNLAKYSEASSAVVRVQQDDGYLCFSVIDDGKGFDEETVVVGAGTTNMADRLEALGGSLSMRSRPGQGTTVEGRIPVTTAPGDDTGEAPA